MRLANSKAADGVAWKIQVEELARAFAPQVREGRALDDTELPLRRWLAVPTGVGTRVLRRTLVAFGELLKMVASAARPGRSALEGGFGFFARRGPLNGFIDYDSEV